MNAMRNLMSSWQTARSTNLLRLRPHLESLEERTAPAILIVNPSDPHAFHTIGSAIAAGHAGDVVLVAPALYHEDVLIDKSLLLVGQTNSIGQRPVIDGAGGASGAEAVVQIANNISNVLVKGFGIISPHSTNAEQVGVALGTGDSNIQVVYNNIHDLRDTSTPVVAGSQTIGVLISPQDHAVLIAHDAIYNITYGTTGVDLTKSYAYGVLAFSDTATDGASEVAIRNNLLFNIGDIGISVNDGSHYFLVDENIVVHVPGLHLGYGIATGGTNGSPSDIYITNNRVAAVAGTGPAGIAVGNTATDVVLIGNHVTGVANGAGLGVATSGSVAGYLNDFSNNALGVFVRSDFTGTLILHGNNIAHNSMAGIENDSTVTVNGQSNWWGSPTGPTNAGNPGGTGDKVIGPVDFSNWLIFPVETSAVVSAHTANALGARAVSDFFSLAVWEL
jgi:hypothetical protein